MKKLLLAFILTLLLISSANAFDIYDKDGVEKTYFSLSSSEVNIESDIIFDNYTVTYELLDDIRVETFNFSSCDAGVCGLFDVTDLITSINDTFVGSKIFTVSVGLTNRTVYFDFETPTFTLTSSDVNVGNESLDLEFEYEDNSGLVSLVEIFKRSGSDLTKITNVSVGDEEYHYPITASENLTLVFRVTDQAGNIVEEDFTFEIDDIFKPKIDSLKLIQYEDESFGLDFEVSDDNLHKYEIIQDNLSLSGFISGTGFSTDVDLPFTTGTVEFKVLDSESNEETQTVSLDVGDGLKVEDVSEYVRSNTFSLSSADADSCQTVKVDNFFFERAFSKSGNSFTVSPDYNGQDEYEIDYFCENENLRQYFSSSVIYDTGSPSTVELEAVAQDDGTVLLEWEASEDTLSGIDRYVVIRDGDDEVYSGLSREYEDDEVGYPNEYEYEVVVYDKAGNSRDSNEVEVSPVKTDIDYDVNLRDSQTFDEAEFDLRFEVEEEVTVTVVVKHEGITIYDEELEDIGELASFELEFREGMNIVELEIEDAFGNTETESFFVTYEEPVLVEQVEETIPRNEIEQEPIVQNAISAPENDSEPIIRETTTSGSSGFNWWFLLLILLVLLVVLLLGKFSSREKVPKKRSFSKKKSSMDFLSAIRSSDNKFNSDLEKIKKKREERQREREALLALKKKKEEKAQKREKSEFEKRKLEDLKNRREIEIPFQKREQARKRVTKIRREAGSQPIDERPKREFRKKDDGDFSAYLNKVKSGARWNSTSDYVKKKEEPRPVEPVKTQESKSPEKIPPEPVEAPEPKRERVREPKVDLDDYLNKRASKKKRFSIFTERAVDRDIRARSKK